MFKRWTTMQFGLSESQQILKHTAQKFFAGECPTPEVRRLMETATAYDAELWAKMAGQGFTGIILPEEYGGGCVRDEALLPLCAASRLPVPSPPLFSTHAPDGV